MSDPTSPPLRPAEPWLVASRCTPTERADLVTSVRGRVPVVGRPQVGAALAHAVRSRSAAVQRRVDELRDTLDAVVQPDDVDEERAYLVQLAEWCDLVPHAIADAARTRDGLLDEVSRRAVSLRDAERALDDVLAQRAVAERALSDARLELEARAEPHSSEAEIRTELERLASAASTTSDRGDGTMARIRVLERRLEVRAAAPDPSRDATVAALAEQAETLEARLTEAVDAARDGVTGARVALEEAEADVDRLDAEGRQRQRKLREAADELRTPEPWSLEGDLSGRARDLAAALRSAAAALRPEDLVPKGGQPDPAELQREIDRLESQIGVLVPGDVDAAVAELVGTGTGRLLLDEPVSGGAAGPFLDALRAIDARPEVVVVTDDAAVWSWLETLPVGEWRSFAAAELRAWLLDVVDIEHLATPVAPAPDHAPPTVDAGIVSIETLRSFSHRPEVSRRDPT